MGVEDGYSVAFARVAGVGVTEDEDGVADGAEADVVCYLLEVCCAGDAVGCV